jgi:hypothetical protein
MYPKTTAMLFDIRSFCLGWSVALYLAFITIYFNVQGVHSQISAHTSCTQDPQLDYKILVAVAEVLDMADYGSRRMQTLQGMQMVQGTYGRSPSQERIFRAFAAYFTNLFYIPQKRGQLTLSSLDPNAVRNVKILNGKSSIMIETVR